MQLAHLIMFLFLIFYMYLLCMCTCVPWSICEGLRKLVGVSSLLLPCGSQGLNSGSQTWQQASSPADPFAIRDYFFKKLQCYGLHACFPHPKFTGWNFLMWWYLEIESLGYGLGQKAGALLIKINAFYKETWMSSCFLSHSESKKQNLVYEPESEPSLYILYIGSVCS